jgi:hypothetical protein
MGDRSVSDEYWAKNIVVPANGVELIKKAISGMKCRIVRDAGPSFGIVFVRGLTDTYMEEDVSISVEPSQIYVVFHSAVRADREKLIAGIQSALSSAGVDCRFKEE